MSHHTAFRCAGTAFYILAGKNRVKIQKIRLYLSEAVGATLLIFTYSRWSVISV